MWGTLANHANDKGQLDCWTFNIEFQCRILHSVTFTYNVFSKQTNR